jgi:tetratricopeptide (TPR) repeat protein
MPFCLCALLVSGCQMNQQSVKLPRADALPVPKTSYLDLGRDLLRQNRIDLARDAFIRSLRVEGVTAAALTGAGIAAERQGLLSEARSFFEKARAEVPDSVLAHNNLGAVHFRLGEYHAAKRAFQAAFALSSGKNDIAAQNLGLAELAIARQAEINPAPARNPIRLQRLGTGAYKLEPDGKAAGQG